jgi:hypothetical protein
MSAISLRACKWSLRITARLSFPNNSDDRWTDDGIAELEKELELALVEQVNSSSASAPSSLCPRSVKAPQDEIKSRERTETTSSRLEELRDASRHSTPA